MHQDKCEHLDQQTDYEINPREDFCSFLGRVSLIKLPCRDFDGEAVAISNF